MTARGIVAGREAARLELPSVELLSAHGLATISANASSPAMPMTSGPSFGPGHWTNFVKLKRNAGLDLSLAHRRRLERRFAPRQSRDHERQHAGKQCRAQGAREIVQTDSWRPAARVLEDDADPRQDRPAVLLNGLLRVLFRARVGVGVVERVVDAEREPEPPFRRRRQRDIRREEPVERLAAERQPFADVLTFDRQEQA